jgi:hypothetical protein
MWNWNPFKKKVVEPVEVVEPKTYEFPVVEHQLKKTIKVGEWRTGMWVISDGKIAILHKIVDYSGEVHYVNEETGETYLIKLVPLDSLTQAKYNQIPSSRLASFDREVARSMGYGD